MERERERERERELLDVGREVIYRGGGGGGRGL
jgi:hypothetical protein